MDVSIEEANKIVVREYYDAVEKGLDAILEARAKYFDRSLVVHSGGAPPVDHPDAHEQYIRDLFGAFPDLRERIDELVAEGDRVVARFTSYGTHQGPMWGILATGRACTCTGITIYRLSDGKVVEQWTEMNLLGLMQQLDAIPSPG
jgi:predicted ester cyclase